MGLGLFSEVGLGLTAAVMFAFAISLFTIDEREMKEWYL